MRACALCMTRYARGRQVFVTKFLISIVRTRRCRARNATTLNITNDDNSMTTSARGSLAQRPRIAHNSSTARSSAFSLTCVYTHMVDVPQQSAAGCSPRLLGLVARIACARCVLPEKKYFCVCFLYKRMISAKHVWNIEYMR